MRIERYEEVMNQFRKDIKLQMNMFICANIFFVMSVIGSFIVLLNK